MSAGVAAPAGECVDRAEYIARVLRGLQISGRRLMQTPAGWTVTGDGDKRRRGRLLISAGEAAHLAEAGTIVATEDGGYVLADGRRDPPPVIEPWAFMAAGVRELRKRTGIGFTALAIQARKGIGPLTLRHVKAGLRLIADVEQASNSGRLTMDWDGGPVDRQRRGPVGGGLAGAAASAEARLRRVRRVMDTRTWTFVWALCAEGTPLRHLTARFGLTQRGIGKEAAEALDAVALAYDRG